MTHDDIIRLALESGGHQGDECEQCGETHLLWIFGTEELECFAALVAAAERERAILIAKDMKQELQAKFEQTYMEGVIAGATAEREACAKLIEDLAVQHQKYIAAAIRARGQE